MVVTVRSLGLGGINGYEVSVECFLSGGLPAFDIVGLPGCGSEGGPGTGPGGGKKLRVQVSCQPHHREPGPSGPAQGGHRV